jgi:hypothetical protein
VLTELALAALSLTILAGLTMFAGLFRARRLPRLIWFHAVTVLVPFCGWVAYTLGGGRPRWLALAVLLVLVAAGMPSGDQLMLRAWRARTARAGGPVPTGVRAYLAAAGDTLGFGRPVASLHAILGAVGFFSVLLIALGVVD